MRRAALRLTLSSAFATLLAALLVTTRADSHSQPFSWIDLVAAPDSLRGEVTAHIVDLAHELGVADPEVLASGAGIRAHETELRTVFAKRLDLRGDGTRLAVAFGRMTPVPEKHAVRVSVALARPKASTLEVHGPLFTWEDTHETYVNLRVNGRLEVQDLLDQGHLEARWETGARRDPAQVVFRFIREGIHHIFIGPDHILFILGLLLLGGSLQQLARIVTAFTLAHSVTLALATLGWVQPSARVIEPLIALSIVVVGIENLRAEGGRRDLRAPLAFAFGFVHGFGFASVLRELSLPTDALGIALVSFNIGVELAQMSIVLTVAPLLARLRIWRPAAGPWVLRVGSLGVIAAGGFWLVQRLLAG
ncbi:MAG: HupE/UreJ family protein [Candidatus Eisenbacteria bacterium]